MKLQGFLMKCQGLIYWGDLSFVEMYKLDKVVGGFDMGQEFFGSGGYQDGEY